jgi:phenylacetate-CoA ligase
MGGRVFDHFGNRENTISASQLRCGNYHINSEFVYMELVANQDKSVEGSYARVVGTSLLNYAMPLIRYDSDDLAIGITGCNNPECTNEHPTIRFIGGREKDFIVTREGLLYCLFDDEIVYEGLDFLEEYQIVQEDLDNLTLKVVTAPNFRKDRDEPRLMDLFRRTTRDQFQLALDYVDSIPRTKGWKKSRVISKLAQADLAGD